MKKVIAAAGLGAAIAIGSLAGAGTAQATPQDFFNSLENGYNVNVWDYPMMLSQGYTACQLLWDDVNPSWWLRGVGYDPNTAGAIISSAQYGLCPGNAVT